MKLISSNWLARSTPRPKPYMPFRISMYIQPSTARALRLYFWIISSGEAGKQHFHVFKRWQRGDEIIVFNVHHHHGGVLGGEGAVD
jgi:hypothetical protein